MGRSGYHAGRDAAPCGLHYLNRRQEGAISVIPATDLRPGMVIRFDRGFCRVLDAQYHAGGGKLAGAVHAKLEELGRGAVLERRFRPDERLARVELERARWQYIYAEGEDFYFMNPDTFEQIPIARGVLGAGARFLRPDMGVSVESYDGRPVNVVFPESVEMKVASTAQAEHQRETSAMKPATLDNGMEILVPLFIKAGDVVRVNTATGKYLERARQKS
jgi:elongation factor P